MKKACVILADGFEEVEALTSVDYLRRAGVDVVVAGLSDLKVTGSHGIVVIADALMATASGQDGGGMFDAIIVPGGGKGAQDIAKDPCAVAFITRNFAAGKLVAAICAAPVVVLHEACGLLRGRNFTGYPGTEGRVVADSGARFLTDRVVVDRNLITSRAAGTSGEFAVAIVKALVGDKAARELSEKVLLGQAPRIVTEPSH